MSFVNIHDHLPEGFYDADRDRPFMPLSHYEQNFDLNSREVILVDRRKDEGLDALTLAAQTMVYNWKTLIGSRQGVDDTADVNLQVASLLALFVSDRYGGSDRSSLIQRARKGVSGSNYSKPFVCTCSTGSGEYLMGYTKQNLDMIEDAAFPDICENSFQNMKARINSCIIPIGALQFGLCRHRAILMKYLCDRMDPPVPCELVRGYLDFCPHAWNVVLVKRRGTWVRIVVDAYVYVFFHRFLDKSFTEPESLNCSTKESAQYLCLQEDSFSYASFDAVGYDLKEVYLKGLVERVLTCFQPDEFSIAVHAHAEAEALEPDSPRSTEL